MEFLKNRIGIISPYKSQVRLIKQKLYQTKERLGLGPSDSTADGGIEVNTVDAYQGREKDIIIISTVRSGSHGLGFLNDYRRMNVAITRAKHFLWIIGNSKALCNNENWRGLVESTQTLKYSSLDQIKYDVQTGVDHLAESIQNGKPRSITTAKSSSKHSRTPDDNHRDTKVVKKPILPYQEKAAIPSSSSVQKNDSRSSGLSLLASLSASR